MSQQSFQVDLSGIIDLLSHHLYSGPEVFVRELLQNAVDAITMRQLDEPGHQGSIRLELEPGQTLRVLDDGVGLTSDEIDAFLATIASSSKRGNRGDFIGRFGIGLLSCFVVSDEIRMYTRSAKGGPALLWVGRSDGSYTTEVLKEDRPVGTEVVLVAQPGRKEYFEPDFLRETAKRYGEFLPSPILIEGEAVNAQVPPWRRAYGSAERRDQAMLEYGEAVLGSPPFDWLPLHTELSQAAGQIDGVMFLLPWKTESTARGASRIYLKQMLLNYHDQDFLPPWAFFAHAVFNTQSLQPTASREELQASAELDAAKEAVGAALRDHIQRLARQDRAKLDALIDLHFVGLKALALEDEDFYRTIVPFFPFQTSLGEMYLEQYLEQFPTLRYVANLDQFRQVAQVANTLGQPIVNAAYVYEADLLSKLPEVFPQYEVERLEASDVARQLQTPADEDLGRAEWMLGVARAALEPFDCAVELRRFEPEALPALLTIDSKARHQRFFKKSREVASGLWASVLDELNREEDLAVATLHLNLANPTARHLVELRDEKVLQRLILTIYLQSLLMGQHPMSAKEYQMLNDSLTEMLVWGLRASSGRAVN